MKVIERGRSMSGWSENIICHVCGAKLQVEESDLHQYTSRDYPGGSDTYVYFDCGYCNKRNEWAVYSRSNPIPAEVAHRAKGPLLENNAL